MSEPPLGHRACPLCGADNGCVPAMTGTFGEALDVVARRRHQNGRWPLNVEHVDRVPFDMEPGVGKASRWNTLRALRVLAWGGREA